MYDMQKYLMIWSQIWEWQGILKAISISKSLWSGLLTCDWTHAGKSIVYWVTQFICSWKNLQFIVGKLRVSHSHCIWVQCWVRWQNAWAESVSPYPLALTFLDSCEDEFSLLQILLLFQYLGMEIPSVCLIFKP